MEVATDGREDGADAVLVGVADEQGGGEGGEDDEELARGEEVGLVVEVGFRGALALGSGGGVGHGSRLGGCCCWCWGGYGMAVMEERGWLRI